MSFDIDLDQLLASASQMFNGLWPVFALIAGLGLGVALAKFIAAAIQNAF
ncbi:MAG: hypothetical protein KF716_14940 [Anaerolineae bacterium]|nr:hypothetical protein [Anaerolineae bacterium]